MFARETPSPRGTTVAAAEALGITPNNAPCALRMNCEAACQRSVEKLPHSRRYRLLPNGYRICLLFSNLFHKIYAPVTAGFFDPYQDTRTRLPIGCINSTNSTNLSLPPWYELVAAVGLKFAA